MDLYSMLPSEQGGEEAGGGGGRYETEDLFRPRLRYREMKCQRRSDLMEGGEPSPPSPPFEGGGSRRRACSRWSCREGLAYEVAALDVHTGDGGTGIGNKNKSQTNK